MLVKLIYMFVLNLVDALMAKIVDKKDASGLIQYGNILSSSKRKEQC